MGANMSATSGPDVVEPGERQVGRTATPEYGDSRPVGAAAVLLGVVSAVVCALGAWVPSVWSDEAATLSAARRPWGELPELLSTIDAVHGAYYSVVHAWFAVVGDSIAALRLLSALGVGLAVAGTVVLGARLHSRTVGLVAGVVLAVLPRMTWAAIEGRSPALATAVAVWVTVLAVAASRRHSHKRSAAWWCAYGLAVAFATAFWLLLALLPVVHALALWWARADAAERVRQGLAGGAGVVLASPFVLWATSQSSQVSWIPAPSARTVRQVAVDQYFGTAGVAGLPLALVCWALVVVAVVQHRNRDDRAARLVGLGVAGLTVPVIATVAWSFVGSPLYVPKYLAWTSPALALLVALAIVGLLGHRGARIAACGLVVLLAVPAFLGERRSDSKDDSDWAAAARVVDERAEPGDAVVYSDLYNAAGAVRAPGRAIAVAYPGAFENLLDPTRIPSAGPAGELWDATRAIETVADDLATVDRVWWVVDSSLEQQGPQLVELEALGYDVVATYRGDATDVVLLERSS
jgi:mannosyltransferase